MSRSGPRHGSGPLGWAEGSGGSSPRARAVRGTPRPAPSPPGAQTRLRDPGLGPGRTPLQWPPQSARGAVAAAGPEGAVKPRGREGRGVLEAPEPSRAGPAGRAGRRRRRSRSGLAGGRVAAAAAWRSRAGPRRGPPFGSPSRPHQHHLETRERKMTDFRT